MQDHLKPNPRPEPRHVDYDIALDSHVTPTTKSDKVAFAFVPVSYTHLRAHETEADLVCRLLLEKKK